MEHEVVTVDGRLAPTPLCPNPCISFNIRRIQQTEPRLTLGLPPFPPSGSLWTDSFSSQFCDRVIKRLPASSSAALPVAHGASRISLALPLFPSPSFSALSPPHTLGIPSGDSAEGGPVLEASVRVQTTALIPTLLLFPSVRVSWVPWMGGGKDCTEYRHLWVHGHDSHQNTVNSSFHFPGDRHYC